MNDISDDMRIGTSPTPTDTPVSTILPRSAWPSKVAYLKAIFRAKKALENIEKEAGI